MNAEKVIRVYLLKYVAVFVALVLVSGCAEIHKSADYERHRYSQFVVPYDRNDVMYFDATINVEFPDDEAGEAKRMEWLRAWLGQRNMCADNFEIVDRRPFEAMENNPAQHDIRYEVKCGAEQGV